jgi:hypothetical protein
VTTIPPPDWAARSNLSGREIAVLEALDFEPDDLGPANPPPSPPRRRASWLAIAYPDASPTERRRRARRAGLGFIAGIVAMGIASGPLMVLFIPPS